jgi:hypothetical protein
LAAAASLSVASTWTPLTLNTVSSASARNAGTSSNNAKSNVHNSRRFTRNS